MSMQVITEDHYVPGVFYGQGEHTLTRDDIGTRYAMAAIRILVDPNDNADLEKVHALQDAVRSQQEQAAVSRFRSGTPLARRPSATRSFYSGPPCPTPRDVRQPRRTPTRCDG